MHHHTASSVYTDSSEDVSSLASSETPIWDDKQVLLTNDYSKLQRVSSGVDRLLFFFWGKLEGGIGKKYIVTIGD